MGATGGGALGAGDAARGVVAPVASASFFAASLARHPPPPRAPGRYLGTAPAAGLSDRGGLAARAAGTAPGRLQVSLLGGARTGVGAGGAAALLRSAARAFALSRASSSRCCWRRTCSARAARSSSRFLIDAARASSSSRFLASSRARSASSSAARRSSSAIRSIEEWSVVMGEQKTDEANLLPAGVPPLPSRAGSAPLPRDGAAPPHVA